MVTDLDQQEWESASQLVLEASLDARRSGTSAAKAHLDSIVTSRRWQLANRVGQAFNRLAFWR